VDHVVKDRDGRGRYAIRAQHKLAGMTGVQYLFEVCQPLSRGRDGVARLYVQRDKPGGVVPHAVGTGARRRIADLWLRSSRIGLITATLEPPDVSSTLTDSARYRLSYVAARVSTYVTDQPGQSKNAVTQSVGGKRETVLAAIERLVQSGHIEVKRGPRMASLLYPLRPYQVGDSLALNT
jgi:hypothetical protein